MTQARERRSWQALSDPYPLYRELRALGPVVWLTANEMYAFPQYREVREASGNWDVFSSAKGVMMNAENNAKLEGVTLCSDPPEHTQMCNVLGRPLRPDRLREHTPKIEAQAESIVQQLVDQGTFDAATELAEHLPMNIVSDLVGLGDARMVTRRSSALSCRLSSGGRRSASSCLSVLADDGGGPQ
jgi:cytochrome P450